MRLNFDQTPDNKVLNCLATRCHTALMDAYGEPSTTELAAFMRDNQGVVVGGIYGSISGSWLYIDVLWLAENQRGKGYGIQLMQCLEQAAIARGIQRAFLGTATFQAPQFYEHLGYQQLGCWHFPRANYTQFIMVRDPLMPYNLPPCPFTITTPPHEDDISALSRALSHYNEGFTGLQLTELVGVAVAYGADDRILGGIAGWRMGERLLPRFLCAEDTEQAVGLVTTLEEQAGDWTVAMTRAEDPMTVAYFQAAGYQVGAEIDDFPDGRTTTLLLKARH